MISTSATVLTIVLEGAPSPIVFKIPIRQLQVSPRHSNLGSPVSVSVLLTLETSTRTELSISRKFRFGVLHRTLIMSFSVISLQTKRQVDRSQLTLVPIPPLFLVPTPVIGVTPRPVPHSNPHFLDVLPLEMATPELGKACRCYPVVALRPSLSAQIDRQIDGS